MNRLVFIVAIMGLVAGCIWNANPQDGIVIRKWQESARTTTILGPLQREGTIEPVDAPCLWRIRVRKGGFTNDMSITEEAYRALDVGDYIDYRPRQ